MISFKTIALSSGMRIAEVSWSEGVTAVASFRSRGYSNIEATKLANGNIRVVGFGPPQPVSDQRPTPSAPSAPAVPVTDESVPTPSKARKKPTPSKARKKPTPSKVRKKPTRPKLCIQCSGTFEATSVHLRFCGDSCELGGV